MGFLTCTKAGVVRMMTHTDGKWSTLITAEHERKWSELNQNVKALKMIIAHSKCKISEKCYNSSKMRIDSVIFMKYVYCIIITSFTNKIVSTLGNVCNAHTVNQKQFSSTIHAWNKIFDWFSNPCCIYNIKKLIKISGLSAPMFVNKLIYMYK